MRARRENTTPPSTGRLHDGSLTSRSTGTEVDYKVLTPPGWQRHTRVPLVLHLHGAMSSAESLVLARPWYEREWARGALPPCLVACASTPTIGGFYLDHPDGPSWAALVDQEFPRHLDQAWGVATAPRAVVGTSMGGFGALMLGFGRPDIYSAIVAVSPAIFPGEHPDQVPDANLRDVLGELHRAMGADDPRRYVANSVYGPLRENVEGLRRHQPAILIDSGGADEFGLHDGAEYLHRLLWDLSIPHDYRLVAASGHLGAEAEHRQSRAVNFLAHALSGWAASRGVRDHVP